MKKMIAMLLVCLMAFAVCGASMAQAHTHTAQEAWQRDAHEHWHECECGEKLEAAAHRFDGDYEMVCTVCGSEVWLYDDGSAEVYDYDGPDGQNTRHSVFDAEGMLTDEYVYEYQYDENGVLQHDEMYWNGSLAEENDYRADESGEAVIVLKKNYFMDGTYSVSEYDEYGNMSKAFLYEEDGTLYIEQAIRYEYDELGEVILTETIEKYDDGTTILSQTNEHGDEIKSVYYDENGEAEFEYTMEYGYHENGWSLWKKVYCNGVLDEEVVYAEFDDGWIWYAYDQLVTDYYEDGSKSVAEYNELYELVKETMYNADGSIEYEYTYEYEYNENGDLLSAKQYDGERLAVERTYAILESEYGDMSYEHILTEYAEDGSRKVTEYDEYYEIVSETEYDAEGNEIVSETEEADEDNEGGEEGEKGGIAIPNRKGKNF